MLFSKTFHNSTAGIISQETIYQKFSFIDFFVQIIRIYISQFSYISVVQLFAFPFLLLTSKGKKIINRKTKIYVCDKVWSFGCCIKMIKLYDKIKNKSKNFEISRFHFLLYTFSKQLNSQINEDYMTLHQLYQRLLKCFTLVSSTNLAGKNEYSEPTPL